MYTGLPSPAKGDFGSRLRLLHYPVVLRDLIRIQRRVRTILIPPGLFSRWVEDLQSGTVDQPMSDRQFCDGAWIKSLELRAFSSFSFQHLSLNAWT